MDTDDPNLNPHRDAERRRFFASIKWPVHSRVVSATFENPKGDNKRAREGESEATKVVGVPSATPYFTYDGIGDSYDGVGNLMITQVGRNFWEEDDGEDEPVRFTMVPRSIDPIAFEQPKSVMSTLWFARELTD